MSILSYITEDEFTKLNIPILFHDANTSRRFGILLLNKSMYKFSWRSDLMDPTVIKIQEKVFGIGIDQNYTIVDFDKNIIILNLNLDYNFLETIIREGFIYIASELEVIILNRFEFNVVDSVGLPDVFKSIDFVGDKVKVKCYGNYNIEIM